MAKKPSQAQLLEELLTRYAPDVAEAFRKAVEDLAAVADLQRLIVALREGNLDAAIDALHLDPAAYSQMLDVIAQAYSGAGQITVETIPTVRNEDGARVVVRFDARNQRAEAQLKEQSADLVTRIVEDQREAIRGALEAGMRRGANPRNTALDIVGRVNRVTGRREGGVIGLTAQQEAFSRSAAAELSSADPGALRAYLERKRRDKRFDPAVKKAIASGKPVPAETARKAVERYRARLLQLRGEMIGLHETFSAIGSAKEEAYRQLVDKGRVTAGQVTKTWRHFHNDNPRAQHIAMQGKAVSLDQPFVLPDGTVMRFPHDPRAPVRHTAGCHCQADYKIDFLAGLG